MSKSLSTEFVSAMTEQTTNILLLCLLRVKHGNQMIHIVNNTEPVRTNPNIFLIGRTLTWQPFPFSITLPQDGNEQVPTIPVRVMNITQEVSRFARTVAGSTDIAQADLYIVTFNNPNTILLKFENFDIKNVQYDMNTVTFDMRLHQTLERAFVKNEFTPSSFPNLFT